MACSWFAIFLPSFLKKKQDPGLDFFSGFQIIDRFTWIVVVEGIHCQSIAKLVDFCKELQAREKETDISKSTSDSVIHDSNKGYTHALYHPPDSTQGRAGVQQVNRPSQSLFTILHSEDTQYRERLYGRGDARIETIRLGKARNARSRSTARAVGPKAAECSEAIERLQFLLNAKWGIL